MKPDKNQNPAIFKKKRFNYITDPKFQFTLVGANLFCMLLAIALICIQAQRSYDQIYNLGIKSNLPANHEYFMLLDMQQFGLIQNLVIAFSISIILSTIFTLIISNKVVGPIMRLKIHFNQIIHTKVISDIRFRKNDFFLELPVIINRMFETIKNNKQK